MKFETKWNHSLKEISKVSDALGMPVDAGIRDMVIVLWILGFPTSGSCEGHIGRGCATPWVDIQADAPPPYRWKGEKEAEKKILTELGAHKIQISSGRGFDSEVWRKFKVAQADWLRIQGHEESKEFLKYMQKCLSIYLNMSSWVDAFNQSYATKQYKIVLNFMKSSGHTRISVLDEWMIQDDVLNMRNENKSSLKNRQKRLEERQSIMKKFTDFLIDRAKFMV